MKSYQPNQISTKIAKTEIKNDLKLYRNIKKMTKAQNC